MKNKVKFLVLLVLTILSLIASFYLLNNDLSTYAIVFITLTFILFILTIVAIPRNKSEDAKYAHELKQILKKYDAILAEIGNIPNLEDKNIMLITNIEDMVDAAVEIRKPVYYKKEDEYCIFSLLDNQDMCIYLLKQNKEETTPIEEFINNRKQSIEKNIADSKMNKENNIQKEKEKINEEFTELSNDNIEDELLKIEKENENNDFNNELEETITIENNDFYKEIEEAIENKIDNIPITDDDDLI